MTLSENVSSERKQGRSKSLPALPKAVLLQQDSNASLPKESEVPSEDNAGENWNKNTRKPCDKSTKSSKNTDLRTLCLHYYPEGGWGYVVLGFAILTQMLCTGAMMSFGVLRNEISATFNSTRLSSLKFSKSRLKDLPPSLIRRHISRGKFDDSWLEVLIALLGSLSLAVPLLLSPLTIALCRRKSTRLAAVLGGLIAALGCLFSSFASQFLQLFLSYGIIFGTGVGLTRDTATLMVGQYFKRRREMVEIILMSGSGVGIAAMSAIVQGTLSTIGWRFGLQVVTCLILLSSLFGCCYRSASLYHPQRRAILHLKNQRRKIKDKTKIEEKPPLLDFSTLRSKTVRILLVSTAISYWGILAPLVLLVSDLLPFFVVI
ncbi:monocarboxylate transporter 2-like isoform X2 [Artemia franciscana]|uniref:monocarboxylate transporter 2-like isoform X2 n=1 Tax=Artemia franciscana TaxID=6661 RepID=UPI0032DBE184